MIVGTNTASMGGTTRCVWPPRCEEDAVAVSQRVEKPEHGMMAPISPVQRNVIAGRIFISNADAAEYPSLLKALEVTAVITVGAEHTAAHVPDYLHIGIHEDRGKKASCFPMFLLAEEFAGPIIAEGRSLLLLCPRGTMHRSTTKIAAALLIRYAGLTATQAIRCVQNAQSIVITGLGYPQPNNQALMVDAELQPSHVKGEKREALCI